MNDCFPVTAFAFSAASIAMASSTETVPPAKSVTRLYASISEALLATSALQRADVGQLDMLCICKITGGG